MWDYWINGSDSAHAPDQSCLEMLFDQYVAEPTCDDPLTVPDKALVQMFELRLLIDFALEDILVSSLLDTDEAYYTSKASLAYISNAFQTFDELRRKGFSKLPRHIKRSIRHLDHVYEEVNRQFGQIEALLPDPVANPVRAPKQKRATIKTPRNAFAHPDYDHQDQRSWYGSKATDDYAQFNATLICANLINVYIDGIAHAIPDELARIFGRIDINTKPLTFHDYCSAQNCIPRIDDTDICLIDLDSLPKDAKPLLGAIVDLRRDIRTITINASDHLCLNPPFSTLAINSPHRYKIIFHIKYLTILLHKFVEWCNELTRIKNALFVDDPIIKQLLACEPEIKKLRMHSTHIQKDKPFISFPSLLHMVDYANLFHVSALMSK